MSQITKAQRSKAPEVSVFIQCELARRNATQTTAVEAAEWLENAGLLKDSKTRRGRNLRQMLRAGLIDGQEQLSNSRWLINRRP